ncbi:MAG: hypothetical protein H6Q55_2524, partial [Deltaproteobacteria bacterium]|nr:hypothetical protein [Deltaproteobacteria bacterium]
ICRTIAIVTQGKPSCNKNPLVRPVCLEQSLVMSLVMLTHKTFLVIDKLIEQSSQERYTTGCEK